VASVAVSVCRLRDRLPVAALTLHLEHDSLSFMALLRGLFWLVLFVVLAFSFVVLFEYGPHNFAGGFQKEFARVKTFVVKKTEKVQKPKKQR
jgi:CBS domain containing-hemolysin-like protein